MQSDEVNVRGSFLVTKYSLLEMKKNNYGRILLVASIAGKEVRSGGLSHMHTHTHTHNTHTHIYTHMRYAYTHVHVHVHVNICTYQYYVSTSK